MSTHRTDQAPENNLSDAAAVAKIREIALHAKTCLFGTAMKGKALQVRPMGVQEVDESGSLWFLSGRTSRKNQDIAADPAVQVLFCNPEKYEFMSLDGPAIVHHDRQLKEKFWNALAKTWFPGGVDDPELTVIEVRPTHGYYWNTKDGKAVSFLKIAFGAITGQRVDVGEMGRVSP